MNKDWLKAQFGLHPDKTKADLAKYLGLSPPAVSKIMSGQRQIKAQEYIQMRRFFGLPSEEKSTAGRNAGDAYHIGHLGLAEKDAGDDGKSWVMPASLFKARTDAPPEKIKIFAVQEQAMAPDFMPGEQVLVNLADTRPSPPGMFIVSDGMGYIIRQCEYVPHSQPPQIKLSAVSEKYKPYTLPLSEAQIIGRIIAKLEWL